ncbi:hypothetical protein GT755_12275 [Herbidospora sp. NEAU-GS84]|uniref:Helix-turn-helix domain-containing protein n=1 Tax=Herbidospora solisilvae TaxID=2696284 RepID=A0A7C9NGI7_9ACTN|nr:helix-turn-helix domain-containing protein [Herbidospora solisilvae]NAS22458.1 hypothetical protein [Herbidospora solisilvae]
MTRAPHPLVTELAKRTRDRDLTDKAVAKVLEVSAKSVSNWRHGKASPPMGALLGWSALVEAAMEAVDRDGRVVLRDDELVEDLRSLRRARGWSQEELAERRHVSKSSVISKIEADARGTALATYLAHIAVLDVRLRLVANPPSKPHPMGGPTLSMPKGGACTRTAVDMMPAAGDEQAEDEAREVCLNCTVFVACLSWARTVPEQDDPGGVLAAMTLAERQPTGIRTCSVCEKTKPMAEYAWADDNRRARRAECRACVRVRARALQIATVKKKRATERAAAEQVAA